MGYLCLTCHEEYNGDLIIFDRFRKNNRCPKSSCGDLNLIEVDDLILPAIKLLNIKGYLTTFCCSGHSYEASSNYANTYIAFSEDNLPSTLPKGFYVEDDEWYEKNYGTKRPNDNICIRKNYKRGLTGFELHIEICKTMIALMKWAEGLEDIDY